MFYAETEIVDGGRNPKIWSRADDPSISAPKTQEGRPEQSAIDQRNMVFEKAKIIHHRRCVMLFPLDDGEPEYYPQVMEHAHALVITSGHNNFRIIF